MATRCLTVRLDHEPLLLECLSAGDQQCKPTLECQHGRWSPARPDNQPSEDGALPNSGPNSASVTADNAAVGTVAWGNTGSATGATISISTIGGATPGHYLNFTHLGFSLPSTASIVAIEAMISLSISAGSATDYSVKIIKGGSVVGTEHAGGSLGGTYGDLTSDLWGVSWLYSDINATGFGVAISPQTASGAQIGVPSAATITVAYTLPDLFGGGPGSVALKYGRTRIRWRDRRGQTVMETSRRGPRIFLPPSPFRKAA